MHCFIFLYIKLQDKTYSFKNNRIAFCQLSPGWFQHLFFLPIIFGARKICGKWYIYKKKTKTNNNFYIDWDQKSITSHWKISTMLVGFLLLLSVCLFLFFPQIKIIQGIGTISLSNFLAKLKWFLFMLYSFPSRW